MLVPRTPFHWSRTWRDYADGPICIASTSTVLAKGAAKVASVLNMHVRPTIVPRTIAETEMLGAEIGHAKHNIYGRELGQEGDCEHARQNRLNL